MILRHLQHTYRLKLHKAFFIFCLLMVLICCGLGKWQLKRYEFKKQLLKSFTEGAHTKSTPFALALATPTSLAFKPVIVKGFYQSDWTILIEKQHVNAKLGYEVFTPLKIDDHANWLLVDRGWLPKSREGVPTVPRDDLIQVLSGTLKVGQEYQFILGNNRLNQQLPLQMQKIDFRELQQITHHPFYPFTLRLDKAQNVAFVREWPLTTIAPERHLGYAIQWFLLALVVSVAFGAYSIERIEETS